MPGSVDKNQKAKKVCVCFVCTGNTCRSPVAERLFKAYLKKQKKLSKFRVISMGLSTVAGRPMSEYSAAVLAGEGINADNHKSRPYSARLKNSVDFFICMTEEHKRVLKGSKHPNIYAVSDLSDAGDIADPFMGGIEDYQKMFDRILYAVPDIYNFLEKQIPVSNDSKCCKDKRLQNT